ncbi:STAS domain-containing protein [Geodermatophilus sp. SYSU D00703]
MTTADRPAEPSVDGVFDDLLALSTRTGEDGTVTVTAAGEVDTFTAPLLRSVLDPQLQRQPTELVIDLSGVQFLGSAGLAVLVETQKSALDRDVALRLITTTGAVTRALTVTGLIDLFTVTDDAHRRQREAG